MADAFRPLTLLLAAFCLWALSVLVLAIAGLGSRFPAAASLGDPPPIPTVSLTRSKSRLGPLADYLEVGQRPLLNQDRRPAPTLAADGEGGTGELDATLTSVLITPTLQLAIFTDNKDASTRRVKVGENVPGSGWRLVELKPRSAVLEGPSGQRTMDLRVFDGKGGQAPTPSVALVSAPNVTNPDADASGSAVQNAPGPPPQVARAQPQSQASGSPAAPAQPAAAVTPDQQVESIRRRIEARRAQMRAEAAAAATNEK